MSNAAPGWQASDGQWYPPETHPNYVRPPDPLQPPAATTQASELAALAEVDEPVGRVADEADHTNDPTYVHADGIVWW